MRPEVGPEGWLRWYCVQGVCAAFAPDTLFFLQALQKWHLGFSISLYLLGPEFVPTAHAGSYF